MKIKTILLLLCGAFDSSVLPIQKNKFPPNLYYLLFSLYSVVTVLYVKNYESRIQQYYNSVGLISFVMLCGKKSYSIFLYQQIGTGSASSTLHKDTTLCHGILLLVACFGTNTTISLTVAFIMDSASNRAIKTCAAFR